MKAAAAIAEILKREGVEFLIGYPVNPIIEAAAEADIRTIIVRQERTGLHMADAVSRVTSADRIGVFAMQHGPGAENAFGGVAQAFGDSVPILVLPGGYPRRITDPAELQLGAQLPQRHEVGGARDAGRHRPGRHAARLHPGAQRPPAARCSSRFPSTSVARTCPSRSTTSRRSGRARDRTPRPSPTVARVLAERPAAGDLRRAGRALRAGVERSSASSPSCSRHPVTTSLQGKSAFPENHPLVARLGGRSIPRAVHTS